MKPEEKTVFWQVAHDAKLLYQAEVGGENWQLRSGDFPAEALYTLLIQGKEVATYNDWPPAWSRPPIAGSKYYLVNDRPVQFMPTPSGGMDILALNMRTGEFEREMGYLTKVMDPMADVDSVTHEQFAENVAAIRASRKPAN